MSSNGKKKSSSGMDDAQEVRVRLALEKMFRDLTGAGSSDRDRRTADFVFHMTDWYTDLVALTELYEHPDAHSPKVWNDRVAGFLIHAVGHLMPAAKLSAYFFDPFDAAPSAKKTPRKKKTKITASS